MVVSKVARVIEEYDLDEIGDKLEEYWTANADMRYSLRELANWFNQQLLRIEMERAGIITLDGEIANTYRLLKDDEVSRDKLEETRRMLKHEGLEVGKLEREFVSHQAIHTYLTKQRGVDPPGTPDREDTVEKSMDAVRRLESRTIAVTKTTIDRLRNTDRIDLGDFEVHLTLNVVCYECGTHVTVEELVDGGGCSCD